MYVRTSGVIFKHHAICIWYTLYRQRAKMVVLLDSLCIWGLVSIMSHVLVHTYVSQLLPDKQPCLMCFVKFWISL